MTAFSPRKGGWISPAPLKQSGVRPKETSRTAYRGHRKNGNTSAYAAHPAVEIRTYLINGPKSLNHKSEGQL